MISSTFTSAQDWVARLQGHPEFREIAQTIQQVQADALEHAARLCSDKDRARFQVVDTLLAEVARLKTQLA